MAVDTQIMGAWEQLTGQHLNVPDPQRKPWEWASRFRIYRALRYDAVGGARAWRVEVETPSREGMGTGRSLTAALEAAIRKWVDAKAGEDR